MTSRYREQLNRKSAALAKAGAGLSRRSLFKGAAVAAAALGAVSLSGCGGKGDEQKVSGEPQVITDDSKIVNVTEEFKSADNPLAAQSTWDLPLGTVPFHSEGTWAALLEAPSSARSVNTLGIISLSSGARTTLIPQPTKGGAYGFHDVRCSETVYAWIEMNYAEASWVLFARELQNGALVGEPVELDHGNSDWEPARFTVAGGHVIWQKMPFASGSKRSEFSHCYSWAFGDAKAEDLYESQGRFATWPRASGGYLTIAPRVNAEEGTFYGLTALDLDGGKMVDQLVMPQNVSPFEAVYMNGTFAFSVEANYGHGGSLGNMGTFIGREGGPFVYLSREPLACVAGKGSRYLIKARSSHFVVDTEGQTYAVLPAPDKATDYGDYPASAGETDWFVTFATVRGDNGLPAAVQLRVFPLA